MRTTSGRVILWGIFMDVKAHQQPLNVDDQIKNLESLGLVINDKVYAREMLNNISYFRLIKAYGLGLKEKNELYDGAVTFEQIVELYLFNSNFRQLLFVQIERIEINLRCRVSNYFSCMYGVTGYENPSNFRSMEYHTRFIIDAQREVERNRMSPFVKNFQKNYTDGKVPFYALVELLSFGTLSKFFKNMQASDKKVIASMYGTSYPYLESWIENIAFVRNICAHYGRLYNVNLAKTPTLYRQYTKCGISSIRVFATLLCMKHLLPNDRHWIDFIDTIELLFEKYPHTRIELMGFPDNWKDILKQ